MRSTSSWRRPDVAGGRVAVVTTVTKTYLPFARVLAASIREHHPDLTAVAALTDEPESCFDPADESFQILPFDELEIPDARAFTFASTKQELVVAAKAFALERLLERGYGAALFVDADMLALDRIDELTATVLRHPVTLVPHLLRPGPTPETQTWERRALLSGVFNGGVIGVSNSAEGRQFLAWWQSRLLLHCGHDVGAGVYFDQRWLDLARIYFPGTTVVRDPGINVAYWNLHERSVRVRDGRFEAAGRPCRLFHFSGFEPEGTDAVTRYAPQLTRADVGEAAAIYEQYGRLLGAAGWTTTRRWEYAFGRFEDGTQIPSVVRAIYRSHPGRHAFGDPYATGRGSFRRWLTRRSGGRGSPTNLWAAVHARRPDLQRAFPRPDGADRRSFAAWVHAYGVHEYAIPGALTG